MMQIENHKIIYQLFIKNISKFFLFVLLLAVTTACTKSIDNEIVFNIENVSCEISNSSMKQFLINDAEFQENNRIFISVNDDRYKKIISQLGSTKKIDNENLTEEKYNEYNSIFIIDTKPSSGFNLKFSRAILRNQNLLNLYFEEIIPEPGAIVNTAVTQPYCLLNIDHIDQYEVKVEVEG